MTAAGAHILTINGGSSSIKFALFEANASLRRVLKGELARIGQSQATLTVNGTNATDNASRAVMAPDHTAAVDTLLDWLEQQGRRETLAAIRSPQGHMFAGEQTRA